MLSLLSLSPSTCFPGFSNECCSAMSAALANPAFQKASGAMIEEAGSAESKAFSHCDAGLSPCQVVLPNQTQVPALCCSADALVGWRSPGPAAALKALSEAGGELPGGGNIWWVNINQTDYTPTTAPGQPSVAQRSISHQYPNWYPSACTNTTAIGFQQSMMCHGSSIIECRATVTAKKAATYPVMQQAALDETAPLHRDDIFLNNAPGASYEFVLDNPACHAPIRDQGQCGSCWAFAAADSFSDRLCVRSGKVKPLSPQDLLNCELLNLGCTLGSLPDMAWSFLAKKGIATEACVPYLHSDPHKTQCDRVCEDGTAKVVMKATNVTHLKTEAAMMEAIAEGPIDVTFNVYSDFDAHWGQRTNATYIREKGTGFKGIHSVKMVGYGTGSDGIDYWTCENSWGVSGGFGFSGVTQAGGYFRIRRGTNECGIEKLAYAGWPAA